MVGRLWGARNQPSVEHPVVHVGDTAGVPDLLRRGLEELGVPTVGFTPPAHGAHAGTTRKVLAAPRRFLDARRGIAKLSPALVHVHYATSGLWYLDRHPLVIHCHGTDVRAITGIRRRALNLVFSRADLVLVATPDLLAHVPPGSRYLPNPVDTDLFAPNPEGRGESAEGGDVLVFSAISEVKGADTLIGVVGELLHRRPDLRVTVIDRGDRVEEIVRAGATRVEPRAQSDLPALLGAHRVVLGQQHLRALGTAELQAMSCGRPVVGVADPALYDRALPIARAIGVRDAADAALGLLDDAPRAEALGSEARDWALANHSMGAVARRLAGWYEELRDAG